MADTPFTFKALTVWKWGFTEKRQKAPFRASYDDTLRLLKKELRLLDGRNAILGVATSSREIRQDGALRSDARGFQHPGVVLEFDSKHGHLTYNCDTYLEWTDNVRGITLALVALRAVDRYGVLRRGEQYIGSNRLMLGAPPMLRDQAVAFLRKYVPGLKDEPEDLADAYRLTAAKLHPDKNPGDQQAAASWKKLQEAKEVLGLK